MRALLNTKDIDLQTLHSLQERPSLAVMGVRVNSVLDLLTLRTESEGIPLLHEIINVIKVVAGGHSEL